MPLFPLESEIIGDEFQDTADDTGHKEIYAEADPELLVKPHPLFPDVTLKPRVKGMTYPEGPYSKVITPEAKMLQMSMKFIPLGNHDPKVNDPTYLFKVQARKLPFTKQHKKRVSLDPPKTVRCVRRPSPPPEAPPPTPLLGLSCPTKPGSLLKRVHENFVIDYVDYYNKVIDPVTSEVVDSAQVNDPDKEWSISCARCCKLPTRPKAIASRSGSGDYDEAKYAIPEDYVGPVPFFPDFETLFETVFGTRAQVPEGAVPGWMDANGVFHPAVMGDPLPPDAVIGYLDKDGVFHPVMAVKEGVRRGLIGVRMANADGIGPYVGDPRLAFNPKIVAYQVPGGTVYQLTPEGHLGYVDDFDNFFELLPGVPLPEHALRAVQNPDGTVLLMSRKPATSENYEIPRGSHVGYVDPEGTFVEVPQGGAIAEGGTSAYETADNKVVLISLAEGDDDWWNRLPEGVIGGYIDTEGVFHELKPGEEIPPGGVAAYRNAEGKVYPIRLGKKLAPGRVAGYVDENGEFHELKDGEELPPGATLAFKMPDDTVSPWGTTFGYIDENGVFHELKDGEEVPPGGTRARRNALGHIHPHLDTESLPEGGSYGYLDENGVFHELKEGEELPRGSVLAIRMANGDLKAVGTSAVLGYFDTDGVFHQLKDGESLPEGAILVYLHEDGRVVLVEREPVKNNDDVTGNRTSGYVDADGNFHVLDEGKEIPPGGKAAILDETGQVQLLENVEPIASELANQSEEILAGTIAEYLKKESVRGYMDENGAFHEVIPPAEVPPGGTSGFIGSDGQFHPVPSDLEIGYLDADGNFIVLNPGDTPPPGVQVGYRQSDGVFRPSEAKPSTLGYRDSEGVWHELQPGEVPPEGAVILQGVAGYLDKDMKFHALHPGEEIPEGAMLVYRPVEEDESIPEGARMSYRAFDGTVHMLKEGEVPPVGTILGYVDENGVFHPLRQEVSEGEDVDLRGGTEMTDEERERFEEFKKSVAAQCELEKVEGSLDLGDVFRKTFRLYSHGGSVDINMRKEPQQTQPAQQKTQPAQQKMQHPQQKMQPPQQKMQPAVQNSVSPKTG